MILLSSFALIYTLVLTSSVESKWIQKSWKEIIPVRGYIQLNERVFPLPGTPTLKQAIPTVKSDEPVQTPVQTPVQAPIQTSVYAPTTTLTPTTSAPTTTTTTTTTTPAPTTSTTTTTRAPSTTTTTTTHVPVFVPSTAAPRAPSKTQRKESWREKQERIRFSVIPPPESKGKSQQVETKVHDEQPIKSPVKVEPQVQESFAERPKSHHHDQHHNQHQHQHQGTKGSRKH